MLYGIQAGQRQGGAKLMVKSPDAPAASTVYVTPAAGSPSEVAMRMVTMPAEGVLDDLVEGR